MEMRRDGCVEDIEQAPISAAAASSGPYDPFGHLSTQKVVKKLPMQKAPV